jgi:hypothetical protein
MLLGSNTKQLNELRQEAVVKPDRVADDFEWKLYPR